MEWDALKRDGVALIIAIILLILGLSAVWISKSQIQATQINNDYYYAALIFAPILVYAIASGRIKQLNAGGLGIEFKDVAEQPIEPEPILTFEHKTIVTEKEDLLDLSKKIREIKNQLIYEPQKIKVIVLILYLKELDQDNQLSQDTRRNNDYSRYGRYPLLEYIGKLSKYPSFELVVILDKYKKVKAYISPNMLQNILNVEDDEGIFCREFIEAVNNGNLERLISIPGIVTTTIKRNNTNIDALRIMNDQELEILVVVDENGLLSGVIEREQLLSKILTKIILDVE